MSRRGTVWIPVAGLPNDSDRKRRTRWLFARASRKVGNPAGYELRGCPQSVGKLHYFDIDVETRFGRPVVQRQHTINPIDLTHQRQQFRLAPHDNLACDLPQRLGEPDELDGIPKAVI